jgi:radical SAM family uncharacterized protein
MAVVRPVVLRGLVRGVREARGHKNPLIAGHKLLYRCNLECHMCPFWRRDDEELLTVPEEIRMMDALVRAGVSFLGFEGGEPTLRPDLPDILQASHDRFHTSLVTNGWLLTRRWPDLKRHLELLFVSLDGIGATHDTLRGIPGSFVRAVEGIKVARGDVPTVISCTLTKANLDHAEPMVELARDLGVTVTFQIAYDYSTADAMSPGTSSTLRPTVERLLELKRHGAPIVESPDYFEAILGSWFGAKTWHCKPWVTINIDPRGRIVLPCYVLQEYHGELPAWDVDIRHVWDTFDWGPYEQCNKCALACYLEPSLFSWKNPSMVRERVLSSAGRYLYRRTSRALRASS